MNFDIFNECSCINSLLMSGQEKEARDKLIQLLDYHESKQVEYSPLINHLIRATGLYPYLQIETADWNDRFVYEAFKANTGDKEQKTLHREQSSLLRKLLDGKNIAVSAPTSFGKSFVVDAFISIINPATVVIIVPTIALMDETRRRLYKKFSKKYKIITTPEVELSDYNIFIFPQERAFGYLNKIIKIDILIVDEFYKAENALDKERSPALLKAILELGKKAKQRYFLAPNISALKDSIFKQGMEFVSIDFNTVFSEIHEDYKETEYINEEFKKKKLLRILQLKKTKSLIYAGTYNNIDVISNILNENIPNQNSSMLNEFSDWLKINYGESYILSEIVKKGVGIHNGRLHRSLSQIQIKLFEEEEGLNNIISTSSIIEGVNTSAENVIIWSNKNGRPKLNDFTYKNIIGRSGRMFRHFIGKIFLFEEPPKNEPLQLKLDFPDELLPSIDLYTFREELTREQIIKIIAFNDEMDGIIGKDIYKNLINDNSFQTFSSSNLKNIAIKMRTNPEQWSALSYLNSDKPDNWERTLFSVLEIIGTVGAKYSDMVAYIKAISNNWNTLIPNTISRLRNNGVTIEKFFELERIVTYKIASALNDVNILQKHVLPGNVDISPFISKISNAFLPRIVCELEEYGLPRMVSKKIHNSGIINMEQQTIPIHDVLSQFNKIGKESIKTQIKNLHPFENYILDYFFEGIQ